VYVDIVIVDVYGIVGTGYVVDIAGVGIVIIVDCYVVDLLS